MSVQKFLAEADKLLEKGKVPEALEKLKQAFSLEPSNQQIANKLAAIYLENERREDAAQVYVQLATSLSLLGKSSVAVAVYKKALEIEPNNVLVRSKYAYECEQAGKLGEAFVAANEVLQHHLKRKKNFEALNFFPLLYRVQPRDITLRKLWLESLLLALADQKTVHLLVALCGPPGLVSDQVNEGGDPTELSAEMYDSLKNLSRWFNKDPRITYALAWAAYRKGKNSDLYHFLGETIRREPDYILNYILFTRILAEQKKISESAFVFRFSKENIQLDKSTNEIVLHKQLDALAEKYPWLSNGEILSDDSFDHEAFMQSFMSPAQMPAPPPAAEKRENNGAQLGPKDLPKEIEIELNAPESADFELLLNKVEAKAPTESIPAQKESEKSAIKEAIKEAVKEAVKEAQAPRKEDDSIVFTSIIKVEDQQMLQGAPKEAPTPASTPESLAPIAPKVVFTPQPDAPVTAAPKTGVPETPIETSPDAGATQVFSPMDILVAANVVQKTKVISAPPVEVKQEDAAPVANPPSALIDGDPTQMFSPIEVVKVVRSSQKASGQAMEAAEKSVAIELGASSPPTAAPVIAPLPSIPSAPNIEGDIELSPAEAEAPDLIEKGPEKEETPVDLGDDLLQEPTRVLAVPQKVVKDSTKQLIQEVAQEFKKNEEKNTEKEIDFFFKKSERFVAKRNYYLARKALRHALAIGADEASVKLRLQEIRKVELPDSMYAAISSDDSDATHTNKILERLEEEFEAKDENFYPAAESEQLDAVVMGQLEKVLGENDPKTLIDFATGLFEMGLYAASEKVFEHIIQSDNVDAFNAYYLSALVKAARKDHAGAVSVLQKLARDKARSELEKISVYYSLGEILEKMHQQERSKAFFAKVAKIDANFRNVKDKLGD